MEEKKHRFSRFKKCSLKENKEIKEGENIPYSQSVMGKEKKMNR